MPPKRTSTSEASAMTQAAIKKLVADSVVVALEAQAATMASTSNPNMNIGPTGTHELAVLCPYMVPNSEKLMEVFIGGLPRSIKGNVTASKPQTLEEAISITQRLMEQVIKHNHAQEANDHKQKFNDRRNTTDNNNYQDNRNNNNRNHGHHQQNRRQETFRTYAANNRVGHLTRNYRNKRPTTGNNLQPISVTCNAYGEKGHYANQCSKANNRDTRNPIY
ncbi:hypothetical protein Tco_0206130 [Tanacetum coccineum]